MRKLILQFAAVFCACGLGVSHAAPEEDAEIKIAKMAVAAKAEACLNSALMIELGRSMKAEGKEAEQILKAGGIEKGTEPYNLFLQGYETKGPVYKEIQGYFKRCLRSDASW